jgi:site-specific DNA-adenine methylase
MTNRITHADLVNLCRTLNKLIDSPMTPYAHGLDDNGHTICNAGYFFITNRNGMNQLQRMNSQGGAECPLGNSYFTTRELYYAIHAFMYGWEAACRHHGVEEA